MWTGGNLDAFALFGHPACPESQDTEDNTEEALIEPLQQHTLQIKRGSLNHDKPITQNIKIL